MVSTIETVYTSSMSKLSKNSQEQQYDETPKQRLSEQDSADGRPDVNDTVAIPNGGWVAWLQVLGVFFLFFDTW